MRRLLSLLSLCVCALIFSATGVYAIGVGSSSASSEPIISKEKPKSRVEVPKQTKIAASDPVVLKGRPGNHVSDSRQFEAVSNELNVIKNKPTLRVEEPKQPKVSTSEQHFVYKDQSGKINSAPIVEVYRAGKIIRPLLHPLAKIDPRLDSRLTRAATIADERAHAHSKSRCWHYVKDALMASGVITSYPKSANAKDAGEELVRAYGFKKLPIRDPYAAPVGSVLVYYKGRNRPGHVEIRTRTGFVSDFRSKDACRHPLLGVYSKL